MLNSDEIKQLIKDLKAKAKALETENKQNKLRLKYFEMGGKRGYSPSTGKTYDEFFATVFEDSTPEQIEVNKDEIRASFPVMFDQDEAKKDQDWESFIKSKGLTWKG